ncbi:MAG TPA: NAD(P)-dependent oxidoreductase [Gaiellaceae bacterium]|nr:NAD(P)-dependent oxidoreductase [Gaiellaceae bacterium]
MVWAISGGAGFLGVQLARRLLAAGHEVRSLDLIPPDEPQLGVRALRGDIRDETAARELVTGARILVHTAVALPTRGARADIESVNVEGTLTLLSAAAETGVRRVVFVSSAAVYGVPERLPIEEDDPLAASGRDGASTVAAEDVCRAFRRRGLDCVILRPTTVIGPGRLAPFELLFDRIREGRRIYTVGEASNRRQLLAVEDLVEAIVLSASRRAAANETLNVGAKEFGTVHSDLQALIAHAGSASRLTPVPTKPAELTVRALERARVSPHAEWLTDRDSYTDISKAERILGWTPRLSNAAVLTEAYDWYLANREPKALGPLRKAS